MAIDLHALYKAKDTADGSIAFAGPDEFIEDPNNPRFEFREDPSFRANIKEHGILQPLVCVVDEATGKLRIRFGHRRYRHAVALNLQEIPYLITRDPRQFDDYAQVAENCDREDLSLLELATFIKKRKDAGDKKKYIAEKLRMDASAITHALALVEGPPFILELYKSGKCTSAKYLYFLSGIYKKHGDAIIDIVNRANKIDAYQIAHISDFFDKQPEILGNSKKIPEADQPAAKITIKNHVLKEFAGKQINDIATSIGVTPAELAAEPSRFDLTTKYSRQKDIPEKLFSTSDEELKCEEKLKINIGIATFSEVQQDTNGRMFLNGFFEFHELKKIVEWLEKDSSPKS